MAPVQYRFDTFQKLPLLTQIMLIASIRRNPLYAGDRDYIEGLKCIHADCLRKANAEEKEAYNSAIAAWASR